MTDNQEDKAAQMNNIVQKSNLLKLESMKKIHKK